MSGQPAPSTVPRRAKSARSQVFGFAFLAVLISFVVLAYLTFSFGRLEGEEFSPDNFTRRKFSYYQLPLLQFQITPIDRSDNTNSLEKYLTSEKLVSEIQTSDEKRRWDLVAAATGIPPNQRILAQGEARILCSYLDNEREGKNVWLDWSKSKPELAKILWPTIAKLAREELYVFVPDLLVTARGATEAAALQQQLNDVLANKYLELANTQQKLGRHEQAIELYTQSIQYSPEMAAGFLGRAVSLSATGQQDKASADLAKAQKFSFRR